MKPAGHCMVFAKTDQKVLDYEAKAIVLMHLRFDGKLGFAGGLIEEDDGSIAEGVARELAEEMGLDTKQFTLTEENFIASHDLHTEPTITNKLYFYALQIPEHAILEIEKNAHKAIHFGEEVLGWVRVPLYTMADGYRGLPAFLDNNFAGNSRDQLLITLEKTGILNSTEIQAALNSSKGMKTSAPA